MVSVIACFMVTGMWLCVSACFMGLVCGYVYLFVLWGWYVVTCMMALICFGVLNFMCFA